MTIRALQRNIGLLAAGLSQREVLEIHARRLQEPSSFEGLEVECPGCGIRYPYEGHPLMFCHCGYCRHAVVTNAVCDHCGEEDPPHVHMTPKHLAVHERE